MQAEAASRLGFIQALGANRRVRMDWRYNTIWFDQLPKEQAASLGYGNPPQNHGNAQRARYLSARNFKSESKDFQDLPGSDSLQYLSLTLANVSSFLGIGRFSNLKR